MEEFILLRDMVQISVPRRLRERLKGMKSSEGEAYYDAIEDILKVRSTARDLGESGTRICLVAEVEMLWFPRGRQKQEGLLRDRSGIVKFVSWKNPDAPRLREGGKYLLKDLLVDEFRGEK